MTDTLKDLDYNVLRPMLAEFESMRAGIAQMQGTLSKYLQVIKHQDSRISVLEEKLQLYTLPDPDTALVNRLTLSSKNNRSLTEPPHVIAYAAHLRRVKGVPAQRIYKAGLMSQSKLHGLDKWENQHLLDFFEVNNVTDIYLNGLSESQAREIMAGYDDFKLYLDHKKQEN